MASPVIRTVFAASIALTLSFAGYSITHQRADREDVSSSIRHTELLKEVRTSVSVEADSAALALYDSLALELLASYQRKGVREQLVFTDPVQVSLDSSEAAVGHLDPERTGLWVLGLFGVLLAGVVCSQLYDHFRIEAARGAPRVNPLRAVIHVLTAPRTWMAVMVSPIVFYASYSLVGGVPDNGTAMLLSFQNGFFWQAALATVVAARGNDPNPVPDGALLAPAVVDDSQPADFG